MNLQKIFNSWAKSTDLAHSDKQWLLSMWELNQGVQWSEDKVHVMVEDIKEGLKPTPTDIMADLGCGGGWIYSQLKPFVQSIIGVDFSPEMLKNAKKVSPDGMFSCAELGNLPLKNESFDRILCYFVFINLLDDQYIEKSFLEIIRVLKKEGRALIGQLPDINCSDDYDEAKLAYLKFCEAEFPSKKNIDDEYKAPLKLFDRDTIVSFLEKNCVTVETKDSFNPFYRPGESKTVSWRFDLILSK